MLGYVFCAYCGKPIPPFGPDRCWQCESQQLVKVGRKQTRRLKGRKVA